MNPRVDAAMGRARGFMAGFTTGQKAIVVVAVLGLALGLVALTRWISQPTMVPLYSNLSGEDANAIVEELGTGGTQYELANGGTTILVPQQQVYDLRVSLSGAGLPAQSAEGGYSILDEQSLTSTDFQQNVAYRRALEGELSKTLEAMDGVDTAVVRVAIPQRDVFSTDEDKPTAAVLLDLKSGTELERDQVGSVTRLVANSIENMEQADVSVTDEKGNPLTADSGSGAGAEAANEADEQTALFEDRMNAKAERLLENVVGAGKAKVAVNAQLDFAQRDTTSERYVAPPAGTTIAPESESESTERYNGSGAGAGGTLGQTFPDLQQNTGSGNGGAYEKTDRTVNNNVDKVVERTTGTPGSVERLTVAVVLDAATAGALDPTQVQQIVSNAVGLDAARGDTVQVSTLPFDTSAQTDAAKALAAEAQAQKTAGYVDMAKQAGMWLLGLIVLFVIWRRTRRKPEPTIEATASDLPAEGLLIPPGGLSLDGGALALPADDAAASRDRVRDEVSALVDAQPDDVAAMLTGWLDERKA